MTKKGRKRGEMKLLGNPFGFQGLLMGLRPKKEKICPDCLGRNGCMCSLKPTKDSIKIEKLLDDNTTDGLLDYKGFADDIINWYFKNKHGRN